MSQTRVVRDEGDLAPFVDAWDSLADRVSHPFASATWGMSWWRNAAPAGARLACVVVETSEGLAGIAPLYVRSERGVRVARFLGSGTSLMMTPISEPAESDNVAREIGRALSGGICDALAFEGVPVDDEWPELLVRSWPGGSPARLTGLRMPAPFVSIEHPSLDAWLASKSSNFRQQMRRDRRRLEEAGASLDGLVAPEETGDALAAFAKLHGERWEERGGSSVMTPGVSAMLAEVAAAWTERGRFRAYAISAEGRHISVQLFVARGGEVWYWLGGFDEAWGRFRPALHALLLAFEDSMARGETRLDLGGGGHDYKYRLADAERMLEWITLVPRGSRYARTRAILAPGQIKRRILERLPDSTKTRVKDALAKLKKQPGAGRRR